MDNLGILVLQLPETSRHNWWGRLLEVSVQEELGYPRLRTAGLKNAEILLLNEWLWQSSVSLALSFVLEMGWGRDCKSLQMLNCNPYQSVIWPWWPWLLRGVAQQHLEYHRFPTNHLHMCKVSLICYIGLGRKAFDLIPGCNICSASFCLHC